MKHKPTWRTAAVLILGLLAVWAAIKYSFLGWIGGGH